MCIRDRLQSEASVSLQHLLLEGSTTSNGAITLLNLHEPLQYLLTDWVLLIGIDSLHSCLFTNIPVSYTHLRAHETPEHLVCRLLLEKKKKSLTIFIAFHLTHII
eukprot:TRINITY_DN62229_c0_g1_i2.p1 TRINITY_DN62229_c0_g1~~TRINITY_DN62229_c0_g1_i2.p1  ORF type:complete len:105 (+),score=15.53 TRINITY_DN62229_c0_g1_i2:171-485(+)